MAKKAKAKKQAEPFVTVRRIANEKHLHSFDCYTGTEGEGTRLLEQTLEALEQIFGCRRARAAARRIYGFNSR